MKKSLWFPMILGISMVVGCGSNSEQAKNDSPATGTSSNNVASAKTAPGSIQLPTEPKEVVRLFLDSMRQGNGEQLSALLSTAARAEIQRKKLEIDPIGSPAASFQVIDAAPKDDGYLVSTTWSEPEANGQPASEIEVVFELRKENVGWRICGMAADPQTGDEVQVVNFENLEPAAQETRVASVPAVPASMTTPASAASNGNTPTTPAFPQAQPMPNTPVNQSVPRQNPPTSNQPQTGTNQPLPPVVPSSVQLPPIQASGGQPAGMPNYPQTNPNLPPIQPQQPYYPTQQPQAPNGGFQLPPPR